MDYGSPEARAARRKARRREHIRNSLWTLLVLAVGWLGYLGVHALLSRPHIHLAICPDAYNGQLDKSNLSDNNFTVDLDDNCFGPLVTVPAWWQGWFADAAGTEQEQQAYWLAYWFVGDAVSFGPFFNNQLKALPRPVHTPFRVEGHGKVIFYTNDAAPQAGVNLRGTDLAHGSPPLPKVSELSYRNVDAHFCHKPDDAYYGVRDLYFLADSRSQGIPPEFLFNNRHDDNRITWANGFKGSVPICLTIDTNGNPTDIQFPQPPPQEIQDHLKERISGWKFAPGYIKTGNDQETVPIQFAYTFQFN